VRKLLIATHNLNKFQEFLEALQDLPFNFFKLNDLGEKFFNFKFKETGRTFVENAILKAKTFGRASGCLTLADDSGLCVDYLKGKPGINSHRFGKGSDEDRYQKLLKMMSGVSLAKRRAVFICALVLFDPVKEMIEISKGKCQGKIAFKPQGEGGFGYDPIFIVDGLNKHLAQLSLAEKNQVSHRGKALKKIRKRLLTYL